MLYVAFLIKNKRKSNTIKSYISAIKAVLFNGGIEINEDTALLASLTWACKLNNDLVNNRLPIRKSVISILIPALGKIYDSQPYLCTLYTALILTTYFGLFRIGEMTENPHVIKAKDVHIGVNKPKMLFILHTSKTHDRSHKPQLVKIVGSRINNKDLLCPFRTLKEFILVRKKYKSDNEQFFVLSDGSNVKPIHYRKLLKNLMIYNHLDHTQYGVHGMRAGRGTDLLQMCISVETIRKLGKWKSTAVYAYLRT